MAEVCVITGGGSGMGLAAAKFMPAEKIIVISGRTVSKLEGAAEELRQEGHTVYCQSCDTSDRESVRKLAEFAKSLGTIRNVINSAGLSPNMADGVKVLKVNALGTVYVNQEFSKVMGKGSVIVDIASNSAYSLPGFMIKLVKKNYPYAETDEDKFIKGIMRFANLANSEYNKSGFAYALSKNFVTWYARKCAYIQIYKDPKTAIQKYNRLQFLRKKKKQRGKWTDSIILSQVQRLQSAFKLEDEEDLTYDEAVELARLERMEELALQFDNAHNYMLEKEQYSQQDIDYAFRMNYMEKNGTEKKAPVRKSLDREDFRDNYQSASGIYITLILDKLFYGLKEKVLNGPEQGGLSMETVQNYQTLNQWIDGFLVDRVKPKKKEFRMILRGLYRAMKAGEPGKVTSEKMRERLSDIFTKILVNRNFRSVSAPEKELFANMNMSNYTYTLGQNNEYENSKLLNHMITECLNEDRKKPLDTMVFDD